jgi:hypothetical protein
MDDSVAACNEQLGDQPPVAAPPERLGAHEAGRRICKRLGEGALPGLGSHPGRVAAEGGDSEAAEPFLARLAAAAAAQFHRVAVGDSRVAQGLRERGLSELGVASRAWKAAHVDEGLDLRFA